MGKYHSMSQRRLKGGHWRSEIRKEKESLNDVQRYFQNEKWKPRGFLGASLLAAAGMLYAANISMWEWGVFGIFFIDFWLLMTIIGSAIMIYRVRKAISAKSPLAPIMEYMKPGFYMIIICTFVLTAFLIIPLSQQIQNVYISLLVIFWVVSVSGTITIKGLKEREFLRFMNQYMEKHLMVISIINAIVSILILLLASYFTLIYFRIYSFTLQPLLVVVFFIPLLAAYYLFLILTDVNFKMKTNDLKIMKWSKFEDQIWTNKGMTDDIAENIFRRIKKMKEYQR